MIAFFDLLPVNGSPLLQVRPRTSYTRLSTGVKGTSFDLRIRTEEKGREVSGVTTDAGRTSSPICGPQEKELGSRLI